MMAVLITPISTCKQPNSALAVPAIEGNGVKAFVTQVAKINPALK